MAQTKIEIRIPAGYRTVAVRRTSQTVPSAAGPDGSPPVALPIWASEEGPAHVIALQWPPVEGDDGLRVVGLVREGQCFDGEWPNQEPCEPVAAWLAAAAEVGSGPEFPEEARA